MAVGEFAQVRQHLEEALKQRAEWVGDHDLYAMLVDAAVQQRDEDALHQYTPLAEETAAQYGHALYQATAHRAWGVAHRLVGEYAEAEKRLTQALDVFQDLDTHWQIGRTLAELAELAQAEANMAEARDYFTQASKRFEKIRANPDAARVHTILESLN